MRIETIDLHFQGAPGVIAAYLIRGPGGPVLIETGPTSTLPALLAGLEEHGVEPADVRDVLVTHIHLDHAGAAGWWAQQGARVHVHRNGAPHLIDPSKLLASAQRIYGDRMDRLWGDVLPAPADRVVPLDDGTTLEVGGLDIEVIGAPGHARHHHVFRLGDVAFSGDTAGIQLAGSHWIDLPGPPPEFDLEAWKQTLGRLRGMGLRTLYRTHFGAGQDCDEELTRFEDVLEQGTAWVREMLDEGLERGAMIERFTRRIRARAADDGVDLALLRSYELVNPRVMTVDGIARYWRKRA